MPHCIARIFEQLLILLLPAHGRHRGSFSMLPDVSPAAPSLLRGEDCALVRPYLVAHEQRLRKQRRRVLLFASYGIDLDTRDIHSPGAI